ncbi:MAG: PspC domain-containing protein [Sphingopyxis sp.]
MTRTFHLGRDNRKLMGVCSGIASYFAIDPMLVRLGWVVATLAFGLPVIAYILISLIAE